VKRLHLAGCTFGWLHRAPLVDALRSLSQQGIGSVELTTAPPHLFTSHFGRYERHELARLLRGLGLRVVSVNPSFADINLISTNPEIREVSERQLAAEIELAADLGAACVVVVPGRRHQLVPAPADAARAVLDDGLSRLIARAAGLGITIALENSPYGYLGTSAELLEVVERWDTPSLRITYDVANALAQEDPAEGVARLGPYLALAHVSDAWRTRWAHTSIGRGEVDFPAFAAALAKAGFTGPTVYELADGEDPVPRLGGDLAALEAAGWSTEPSATLSVQELSCDVRSMCWSRAAAPAAWWPRWPRRRAGPRFSSSSVLANSAGPARCPAGGSGFPRITSRRTPATVRTRPARTCAGCSPTATRT
jgi:sugar phosphate isomerase/epimerase